MAVTAQSFAPHEALAVDLLPHAADTTDGSHDLAHILRVFRNATRIHATEGGDGEVLAAESAMLKKGAAVYAYAESLKLVDSTAQSNSEALAPAFAALERAEAALPGDPDLAEIRDLLERL